MGSVPKEQVSHPEDNQPAQTLFVTIQVVTSAIEARDKMIVQLGAITLIAFSVWYSINPVLNLFSVSGFYQSLVTNVSLVWLVVQLLNIISGIWIWQYKKWAVYLFWILTVIVPVYSIASSMYVYKTVSFGLSTQDFFSTFNWNSLILLAVRVVFAVYLWRKLHLFK